MSFSTNGLDALVLDLDEIREIPNETLSEMLLAGGKVIQKAHAEAIKQRLTVRTGNLAGSPEIRMKNRCVLIYPAGEHHTYKPVTGSGVAPNQEVGFIHEFGGHGNTPLEWMREANELHAEEAVDAEFGPFNAWHQSHNL